MASNANWQRWTYATYASSILTDIAAAPTPFPVVIEFYNPVRTPTWEQAATKAEFTVSGPRTVKRSVRRYKAFVDVFAVVTSEIQRGNNYGHLDAVGEVVKALDKCFMVMDYGDTGLIEVGTLRLTDGDDEIEPTHLKPAKDDKQLHSTVLARYVGNFS